MFRNSCNRLHVADAVYWQCSAAPELCDSFERKLTSCLGSLSEGVIIFYRQVFCHGRMSVDAEQ